MTRLYLAGAAILATMALGAATASLAGSELIPGIDIIVRKDPGGSAMVVGTVGANGAFGGSAKLIAGNYIIHTACSRGVRCASHQLTSLMVNGRTVSTAARSGVHVAVGDFNGDGKEELTTFRGTISLNR